MADNIGSVGSAFVDVIVDFSKTEQQVNAGLKNTAQQAEKAMAGFGTTAAKAGEQAASSFGTLGSVLAGLQIDRAISQIANVIAQMTRNSLEFSQTMANVNTLLIGTDTRIEDLRGRLLSLGGELGTSTSLANALYEALSAGVEPAHAIDFVAQSTKLAKAELFDAGEATKLLAVVMNAYGRETTDVAHVSDVFVETINLGIVRGNELAGALGNVIPAASQAGVSIEEIGAAIAVMTRSGLSASEATTSLNRAILAYIDPSKEAQKTAAALGIELSMNRLHQLGLKGAIDEVVRATGGNVQAQAQLMGDTRAFRAVLALTGAQASDFSEILDRMKTASGQTDAAFQTQQNNLATQWTNAWNNAQRIMDRFISTAEGPGVNALKMLNDFLVGVNTSPLGRAGIALPGLVFGDVMGPVRAYNDALKEAADGEKRLGQTVAASPYGPTLDSWNQILAERKKREQEAADATKAHAKEVERVVNHFTDAIKPADDLNRELSILRGRFSDSDIIRIYSERILKATEVQRNHGYEIPPYIDKLERMALGFKIAASGAMTLEEAITHAAGAARTMPMPIPEELKYPTVFTTVEELPMGGLPRVGLPPQMGTVPSASTAQWDRWREEGQKSIDHIVDDMSRMFVDGIAHGKNLWESFKNEGKNAIASVVDTLTSKVLHSFLDPFATAFGKFLDGLTSGLTDALKGLGHRLTSGLFGGGTSTAGGGGIIESIAGTGGPGGGVGGAIGGAGGGVVQGVIQAVGAAGSIAGAIGTFRLEGTMNAVEYNTRATEIHNRVMIDTFFWPWTGHFLAMREDLHVATMQLDAIYNAMVGAAPVTAAQPLASPGGPVIANSPTIVYNETVNFMGGNTPDETRDAVMVGMKTNRDGFLQDMIEIIKGAWPGVVTAPEPA